MGHQSLPAVGAARSSTPETLPPFWDDLAALGWLGLHLPEDVGGSGYGLAELAVVLEELGRPARRGRSSRPCSRRP